MKDLAEFLNHSQHPSCIGRNTNPKQSQSGLISAETVPEWIENNKKAQISSIFVSSYTTHELCDFMAHSFDQAMKIIQSESEMFKKITLHFESKSHYMLL